MPDSSLRWCSKCLESTRSLFSLYCPRRVGADGNSAEGRCAVDCLLSVRERTDASWSWHHSKMFCAALPVSHSKPSRYSKPVDVDRISPYRLGSTGFIGQPSGSMSRTFGSRSIALLPGLERKQ